MGVTQKPEIFTNMLRRNRSKGRSLALQTLFEIDLTKHHMDDVLGHLMVESDLDENHLKFAREIVFGVLDKKKQIDSLIAECATEREVGDLSSLDKSVLRMGILELLDFSDTPPKVVVNEAVELAKIYGSDNSYKFVNGVLGSVLQKLKIKE
ncbi:MAG: transcription antitermination factor NusB [SAR202 cluster bacterium]|nr:transcription antitermination factor NusB [Chloroflexota bacterium]MQG39725.1 transcription antitermination factor NusB [SAR202 cluster bacterium]|tara:strand:- start:432 stop:887 length:456 start_codon:yes stop_codon:yes gene_type:complete